MPESNDQFYPDFIHDSGDVANMDLSDLQGVMLDEFLEPFTTNKDFPNVLSPSSVSLNSYENTQYSSVSLFSDQASLEHLQMIEQPYQSSKLRYRADYIREKGRIGALGNKNEKSKIKGPAILIPQDYLNPNDGYYIRVSLVTVAYKDTGLHYIHPYELEHAKNESFNDRQNNSVWFSIESKDSIKNFPLLRIVKNKAFQVQKLDNLRVFDSHHQTCQYFHKKELDIVKEYNLEKSQLAFTLGKKNLLNNQSSMYIYPDTTIFSDQMDEDDERQSDTGTDSESLIERPSSNHYIYKYAPRSSIGGNGDEMLIFLKKRLNKKKYENLQVVFEYDSFKGHCSQSIVNLDIKHRMISFKIPKFPYTIKNTTTVDILLRQDNRILDVLKYSYLAAHQ